MATDLTADRLRALLVYVPESGSFRWKPRVGWGARNGGRADPRTGYRYIRIDKRIYLEHRVAWLFVHGTWPSGEIDHINGVRGDNRIANLRDVSVPINRQNVKQAKRTSLSGIQGVRKDARRGTWTASIKCSGVSRFLGSYATPEEAGSAYQNAKLCLHPGYVPSARNAPEVSGKEY